MVVKLFIENEIESLPYSFKNTLGNIVKPQLRLIRLRMNPPRIASVSAKSKINKF